MTELLREWMQAMHRITGLEPEIQDKLFTTLFTILFFWLIKTLLFKLFNKSIKDEIVKLRWKKSITPIIYVMMIITIGRIWIIAFHSLANYLGLLSAGIAIALKDPLVNLFAYTYILGRKPFSVGDRINIGDISGDVLDVKLFQFTVLEIGNWVEGDQTTGRIVHVPNGIIFTDNLVNYTDGFNFIWEELNVLITFESNWKKAKMELSNILDEKAAPWSVDATKQIRKRDKEFMVFTTSTSPSTYLSVEESGVKITLRYMMNPRKRRWCQQIIWENVLQVFDENDDIEFAYPTTRFFNSKE